MARRIEIVRNPQSTYALAGGIEKAKHTKTLEVKEGQVTWVDKLKGYYHSLITLVGAILVFLNQITPMAGFLPVEYRHWVDLAIIIATFVANVLKSNEYWVNDL